jgi:transposase InsO family protein
MLIWKLYMIMKAGDVTDTLELALQALGCGNAKVLQLPRLLSNKGRCYVSGELASWLCGHRVEHARGSPFHP